MSAGELRERFVFASRLDLSQSSPPGDGYGNAEGDWVARFTVWAAFIPIRGNEEVLAARLTGVQPGIIRVRYSSQTAAITTAWKAVDARTGREFNIRSIADFGRKKAMLDLTVEAGGNVG